MKQQVRLFGFSNCAVIRIKGPDGIQHVAFAHTSAATQFVIPLQKRQVWRVSFLLLSTLAHVLFANLFSGIQKRINGVPDSELETGQEPD
jgi:hypothetical protein